eukprot:GFYU01001889.1.p1 GENE.GFYU01001889.1~~GFYU01001889.1.p1  ORF type:complete len:697 (-),score=145.93 GFYU01001889.1:152-2242(-)
MSSMSDTDSTESIVDMSMQDETQVDIDDDMGDEYVHDGFESDDDTSTDNESQWEATSVMDTSRPQTARDIETPSTSEGTNVNKLHDNSWIDKQPNLPGDVNAVPTGPIGDETLDDLAARIAAEKGKEPAQGTSSKSADKEESKPSENVLVVGRVRPLNAYEREHTGDETCVTVAGKEKISIDVNSENSKTFTFNRVFHEHSLQEEVYSYCAEPVVEDVLRGYNAAILAYGQTGAGKTHTMMGPTEVDDDAGELMNPAERGIMPRILETIFDRKQKAGSQLKYEFSCSYIEVYKEQLNDLLSKAKKNIKIRENKTQGMYITDATEVHVRSIEEVMHVFRVGARNRKIAGTKMNDRSTRGHSIFILHVKSLDPLEGKTRRGQLYLVDLAGSEKVAKTGATGDHLDEGKKINFSLHCLGNVIDALTDNKRKHVPYRDSKLTRLLKNSFGGNSRTVLIVNVSPSPWNATETLSSLKFGARSQRITNAPKANVALSAHQLKLMLREAEGEIARQKVIIRRLEEELDRTKQVSLLEWHLREMRGSLEIDNAAAAEAAEELDRPLLPVEPTLTDTTRMELSDVRQALNASERDGHRYRRTLDVVMLEWLCPITREIMQDPVTTVDGHTYERAAISEWLQTRTISPLTGAVLASKMLIPNFALRAQIRTSIGNRELVNQRIAHVRQMKISKGINLEAQAVWASR